MVAVRVSNKSCSISSELEPGLSGEPVHHPSAIAAVVGGFQGLFEGSTSELPQPLSQIPQNI